MLFMLKRLYKLKKSDQLDTLKSLGLSGAMLDALKYEEDRVRKIEELYDKNKSFKKSRNFCRMESFSTLDSFP